MSTYFDVAVVGMHHRGAAVKSHVSNIIPPVSFRLEREETNPFDENAIKVYHDDLWIGYINREDAAFIAAEMDSGRIPSCVCESLTESRNNLYPVCTVSFDENRSSYEEPMEWETKGE